MKVVLFCGGLGTRLREHSGTTPKSLVNIGTRPIIWHLMRYYAHYGHKEFILCLGWRGDLIREYFLNYREALCNDFTLTNGRSVELHSDDVSQWRISFIDTGLHATIAERLLAVRDHLGSDDMFLANYSDGLSDIPLDEMIEQFRERNVIASVAGVVPSSSFHTIASGEDGLVTAIGPTASPTQLINGGFFVFRRRIFDYIKPGEELVEQPFRRLIAARSLAMYRHLGYWQAMDTFKDKISLDRREARDDCPWMVWKGRRAAETRASLELVAQPPAA